jgi:5-carboxymethyl-2-hydroxymuconate isomerase
MPHLTLEYSQNLDSKIDMADLCRHLHEALLQSDLFEIGALRVRALAAEHYAIADQHHENCFLDMVFRIGQGRKHAEKIAAGEALMATAKKALAKLYETPHFALSLEIREIDPVYSWRDNGIHARLRANII